MSKIKVVYLAHAVSGDTKGALASIERWFHWIVRNYDDVAVCVPWHLYVLKLDDMVPDDRQRGMRDDIEILKRCDEIWLCGDRVSAGMRAEIEIARKHRLAVKSLSRCAPWVRRGEYPPVDRVRDLVETLYK